MDAPESRHQRVKDVFMDALDMPRGRRTAYVAGACRGDEHLRREVLELLVHHGEEDPVLDAPLDGAGALAGLVELDGEWIGPYRRLRELGRGGMGVVHLCERDGQLFAVKVLAAGAVSPEMRERFRLEADILRRLDHPGIARIVEVGEMPGAGGVSQPWIAMEYVDGLPLHEHVEKSGLGLEARLELLATICDAVQHAHARGIVHRDLKPSNILVRADGRPSVLDFGVARLTGGDERPTELHTRTGQMLGTPQYMSPEQVQAEPAGITPASDVYSLGVLAYELCAGRLPYEASSISFPRAIVTILTFEPPPIGSVSRALRGPLERVVSMALEKAPEHRYADAGAFADDLRRKLAGRTVRARGPSLARRIARWSRRRRRVAAAILALGFAGLLFGAWVIGHGRRTVPRERVRAAYREAETLMAQAIPLLYEGERTPTRLQQAIDLYTRARLQIDQVPPLRHHDPLLRVLEKDLGTAQFLLGELSWDIQPYRSAALTLEHAASLTAAPPGWEQDVQVGQFRGATVPQADLLGLLAAAHLGSYRLWGERDAIVNARSYAQQQWVEILHREGPPRPLTGGPYPFALCFNSLTEITDEYARFRDDPVLARQAVLYSDSAYARRAASMQNWPALGSLLYERGRALRTVGALVRSPALLDSAERYLQACADYRGPERPWVFAQTRQELASLNLDRARVTAAAAGRAELLRRAHRDVDSALAVIHPTDLPPAASAALRSLDAELLAEMALAERRPALLDSAAVQLRQASRDLPSTALPREAARVCVRQAVLARARLELTGDPRQRDTGTAALDRALVLASPRGDSLVLHMAQHERARLLAARARP